MNTTSNSTTSKPGTFYLAKAIRTLYFGNWGIVKEGDQMFVAKWQDKYVVAKNDVNFYVLTAEEAALQVKTVRINGKLKAASNYISPRITGEEKAFTWNVEAGHTCPDGCCGDDCPTFTQVCKTEQEAMDLAKGLESGNFSGECAFVRVMGPGFSRHNWNRPST